ncbi:hypothetical protein GTW37_39430 [Streptomyces sp. SID4931]|nr:hypothetical protein [Streptomyces sp. SID4931]SCG10273.1 hypothetical protein GA0115255_127282 [Streptomyces sp. Ncost-T6T-2b]
MSNDNVRLYGGWRRSRGIGLGNLTPTQTVIVFACILAPLTTIMFFPGAILVVGGVALLVAGVTMARWKGVPLVDIVVHSVRWGSGVKAGQTDFTSGVLTLHEQDNDLPGVLAPVVPLTVEDGEGSTLGMTWNRRSGHLTATILVAPISTALANVSSVDTWVSQWGAWLSRLGHTPMVSHVSVTVDTAPDPGSTLEDYVAARLDPNAPTPALGLMEDLVELAPAASAHVDTRISITLDPAKSPERLDSFGEAVAEASRVVRGLQASLGGAGVSILGKASAARLAGIARTAFDPGARGEVLRALAVDHRTGTEHDPDALLAPGAYGPLSVREHRNWYEHDSGASVSWIMETPPRQHVTSDVLTPLLGPGRYPRRVSLFYEPYAAETAGEKLASEVNAGEFRAAVLAKGQRGETEAHKADRQRAEQAAREEAQGAGLGLTSIVVTTTAADASELSRAVSDVEQRSGSAKIKLRRATRSQAAAFAATLPFGIYLPDIARRRSR